MPSFAELKAKAAGVTNSGVEKLQNVKDRHTSVPMKKTNWDPYSGNPPPPPPPPRVNTSRKPVLEPLPPPPSRTSSNATPTPPSRSPVPPSRSPAPPQLPSRGQAASTPPPPPPRSQAALAPPAPPPRSQDAGPPPPPPARARPPPVAQSSPSPGPPPVARSTRPDMPSLPAPSYSRNVQQRRQEPEIDWTNLSQEDKEVFFSWLDEFFSKHLNIVIPANEGVQKSLVPPQLRSTTKPTSWTRPQVSTDFTLSHPPPTIHGSLALDLAHFFSPSAHWLDQWYTTTSSSALPPPLLGNTDILYYTAWRTFGPKKSVYVGVLFADLSICWGSVEFDTSRPQETQRNAVYFPRPAALSKLELQEANETYGETIASFAESFVGTGEYCARGECWDLANEALKHFAEYDYVPKPVLSISRTHGHLIYSGKADKQGSEAVGRWRGGDDRVRRGDIVEWRKVRIAMVARRGHCILGTPDHTAIVVSDLVPAAGRVEDGAPLKPTELGILVVVEQSVGQPPERQEYNLQGFEEGEVWIYRPIGMQVYLGLEDITARAPEMPGLLRV